MSWNTQGILPHMQATCTMHITCTMQHAAYMATWPRTSNAAYMQQHTCMPHTCNIPYMYANMPHATHTCHMQHTHSIYAAYMQQAACMQPATYMPHATCHIYKQHAADMQRACSHVCSMRAATCPPIPATRRIHATVSPMPHTCSTQHACIRTAHMQRT